MGWVFYLLFLAVLALGTYLNGQIFVSGNPKLSFGYIWGVVTNPLFLLVLGLGFTGALLRMFVFKNFGITRTLIMSEVAVLISISLAALLFKEPLSPKFLVGTLLIAAGVVVIQLK